MYVEGSDTAHCLITPVAYAFSLACPTNLPISRNPMPESQAVPVRASGRARATAVISRWATPLQSTYTHYAQEEETRNSTHKKEQGNYKIMILDQRDLFRAQLNRRLYYLADDKGTP